MIGMLFILELVVLLLMEAFSESWAARWQMGNKNSQNLTYNCSKHICAVLANNNVYLHKKILLFISEGTVGHKPSFRIIIRSAASSVNSVCVTITLDRK